MLLGNWNGMYDCKLILYCDNSFFNKILPCWVKQSVLFPRRHTVVSLRVCGMCVARGWRCGRWENTHHTPLATALFRSARVCRIIIDGCLLETPSKYTSSTLPQTAPVEDITGFNFPQPSRSWRSSSVTRVTFFYIGVSQTLGRHQKVGHGKKKMMHRRLVKQTKSFQCTLHKSLQ